MQAVSGGTDEPQGILNERKWAEGEQTSKEAESEAVAKLFESNYREVTKFFERKLFRWNSFFPPDLARDLTQDTFLRVHRYFAGHRGESQLRTWLFLIAQSVWQNLIRGHSSLTKVHVVSLDQDWQEAGENYLAESRSNTLESLVAREKMGRLNVAVGNLPRRVQRVVRLRLQNLKYAEIATLLGIDVDTVKSHLFQARKLLKVNFEELLENAACRNAVTASCEAPLTDVRLWRNLGSQEQKILDLYKEHRSMRKVAAEIGCSAMWISKTLSRIPKDVLEEHGVEIRLPGYARTSIERVSIEGPAGQACESRSKS